MIECLYANNYKSFSDFNLDLTSINILLGSNSCGKSSITNLLLMLSQTCDSIGSYESLFRLNGQKSSFGEAKNIFKDKKINNYVTIGLAVPNFVVDENITDMELYDFGEFVGDYLRKVVVHVRRHKGYNKSASKIVEKIHSEFNDYFYSMNVFIDNDSKRKGEVYKRLTYFVRAMQRSLELEVVDFKSDSSVDANANFDIVDVSKLRDFVSVQLIDKFKLKPNKLEYIVAYDSIRNECYLKGVKFINNTGDVVIDINCLKSKRARIYSEIICEKVLGRSKDEILKGFNFKSLKPIDVTELDLMRKNPLANYIRFYIGFFLELFHSEIKGTKINHVSPLRAFPQRYYLLEKSAQHITLNSNDGSQLAEVLKNNPDVLYKVNELFIDFDIQISTEKVNDIIHRIVVRQHNISVELTDVGFGISQVLPILVQAFLCPSKSITIIEQPEIHLHPKMQAWLTNALVKISKENNKKFIIETHSDTIIKRLQILLLDPNVNFFDNDLNIFHLERDCIGNTSLKKIEFNSLAEISWPKNFMDV